MSEQSVKTIKKRLEELEREKRGLLSKLSLLQSRRIPEETNHPPIGDRISSKIPTTPDEKIDLFLKLFVCRTDVFPKFWENKKTGKKGYSPVCSNEWVRGICEKPKIKCTDCTHKAFIDFLSTSSIFSLSFLIVSLIFSLLLWDIETPHYVIMVNKI